MAALSLTTASFESRRCASPQDEVFFCVLNFVALTLRDCAVIVSKGVGGRRI